MSQNKSLKKKLVKVTDALFDRLYEVDDDDAFPARALLSYALLIIAFVSGLGCVLTMAVAIVSAFLSHWFAWFMLVASTSVLWCFLSKNFLERNLSQKLDEANKEKKHLMKEIDDLRKRGHAHE